MLAELSSGLPLQLLTTAYITILNRLAASKTKCVYSTYVQ